MPVSQCPNKTDPPRDVVFYVEMNMQVEADEVHMLLVREPLAWASSSPVPNPTPSPGYTTGAKADKAMWTSKQYSHIQMLFHPKSKASSSLMAFLFFF